ncbi:hypothetical protein Slin14017_G114630 [Septoria linicola]|nr:hypothetical protein Slin14017_G114630 [Septoria linicola]
MAAVLIVLGGAMIAERVEKSKEKKRLKKEHDDTRYKELVEETGRRMSRTESGPLVRLSLDEESGTSYGGDAVPPPAYEDVARVQRRHTGGPEERWSQGEQQTDGEKKKKGGVRGLLNKIGS